MLCLVGGKPWHFYELVTPEIRTLLVVDPCVYHLLELVADSARALGMDGIVVGWVAFFKLI